MPHSASLLYLDSDLFVLLAGANLLGDLIEGVGFDVKTTRRLRPLPRMLERGALSRRLPRSLRQRALAWCSVIPGIEAAPSPRTVDRLLRLEDLDPGEAILFALAAEAEGSLIGTGDQRACRALGRAQGLGDVRDRLMGKVICLEASLEALLKRMDFREFAEALTTVREHNQTLRVLSSQGAATPQEDFETALTSYLDDLASEAGELLWRPIDQVDRRP